jgi:NitT/TauT family transport system substrate-binding protein
MDVVMRYIKEYRIATNRTLQWLMLKEVLRLQVDHESGLREFRLRPDMVQAADDLLFTSGRLARHVRYEDLIP